MIVTGPSSMNVSVSSTVWFTCSANDVFSILWYVNGKSIESIPDLDDDLIVDENGTVLTSTNEFEVHEGLDTDLLNNSMITCLGYCFLANGSVMFSGQSTPALLLIQGKICSKDDIRKYVCASRECLGLIPSGRWRGTEVYFGAALTLDYYCHTFDLHIFPKRLSRYLPVSFM